MTTIAYRDGIMASDSAVTAGGWQLAGMYKIRRIGRWLCGATGSYVDGQYLLEQLAPMFASDAEPPLFPADVQAECLLNEGKTDCDWLFAHRDWGIWSADILNNGQVAMMPFHKADYCAIGSGAMFALGAMHQGASAREAVFAACTHDHYTSMPIDIDTLT